MNCFEETEIVIDYIEKNLGDVHYENISKITGIPISLYQRIFAYICGVSISDYIRKRRLSKAAEALLSDYTSVIDVSLEYGYDSHSAFTRAVKEQFGVPPTALTVDILRDNYYERFSFQKNETYYVVKGKRIMADLVKIEYVEMSEMKIIGISSKDFGKGGRSLWDEYFDNGIDKKLSEMADMQCGDLDENIGIGYARDFNDSTGLGEEYIIGAYFKPETIVPDGMSSRLIPKGIIAKAQIKAKTFNDIFNNAFILIKDAVQKNGYNLDYSDFYWSEVYTIDRYCKPAENGEEMILDWLMPCVKE